MRGRILCDTSSTAARGKHQKVSEREFAGAGADLFASTGVEYRARVWMSGCTFPWMLRAIVDVKGYTVDVKGYVVSRGRHLVAHAVDVKG